MKKKINRKLTYRLIIAAVFMIVGTWCIFSPFEFATKYSMYISIVLIVWGFFMGVVALQQWLHSFQIMEMKDRYAELQILSNRRIQKATNEAAAKKRQAQSWKANFVNMQNKFNERGEILEDAKECIEYQDNALKKLRLEIKDAKTARKKLIINGMHEFYVEGITNFSNPNKKLLMLSFDKSIDMRSFNLGDKVLIQKIK